MVSRGLQPLQSKRNRSEAKRGTTASTSLHPPYRGGVIEVPEVEALEEETGRWAEPTSGVLGAGVEAPTGHADDETMRRDAESSQENGGNNMETRTIPLTQGKVTIVDADEHRHLSAFKWHAHETRPGVFYAARKEGRKTVHMHRLIAWALDGEDVDHINLDTLDNRKENLRTCTRSQNMMNRGPTRDATSVFKGVCWSSYYGLWAAQIMVGGRNHVLGRFEKEGDAARAYDEAARRMHGDFALVNFPEPGERGLYPADEEGVAA